MLVLYSCNFVRRYVCVLSQRRTVIPTGLGINYKSKSNQSIKSCKSVPQFLSTSQCKFNGARSCAHASINHPFQPKPPFTKVSVPSMCRESSYIPKFTEIHPAVSLILPYKILPVNKIIPKRASFSSSPPPPSPFQTFGGLREPRNKYFCLYM